MPSIAVQQLTARVGPSLFLIDVHLVLTALL